MPQTNNAIADNVATVFPRGIEVNLLRDGQDSIPLAIEWSACTGRIGFPGRTGEGDRLYIRFEVPLRDVQGFWEPAANKPVMEIRWHHRYETAFHISLPFMTFINRGMRSKLAFGLTDPVPDTFIEMHMLQAEHAYEVIINRRLEPGTEAQEVFADMDDLPWQVVYERYREIIAGDVVRMQPPVAAGEPVYCTWYAMHADLNQDRVIKTARKAAELGFGTCIIDDGWQFDEPRRQGANLSMWYADAGDWQVSTAKFPSFKGLIQDIHDVGMKCLLWIAPTMVGGNTRSYIDHGGDLLPGVQGGYSHLCMGSPYQRERLCRLSADLMEAYRLDGLKIDFLSEVELKKRDAAGNGDDCRITGEGMRRFARELMEAVTAVNPDAMLEYRQCYATAATAPYATQFRAGDIPYDFEGNRARCVNVRINTGPGVICHADPAYWTPEESDTNVALHMLAMMFAVPMVSIDFDLYPDTHLQVLRHYLHLYGVIKDTILNGNFTAEPGATGDWNVLRLEDANRTLIGIYGPPVKRVDLSGSSETILLNGSTGTFMGDYIMPCRGDIQVYDIYGRISGSFTGTESLEVPVGGMAVIRSCKRCV